MGMKFSELAGVYDRIGAAGTDAQRVKLLAEIFRNAGEEDLAPIAHFSFGELVRPEYSDRLGIGPASIREQVAVIAGRPPHGIDEEVREAGDMSVVAAAYANGNDRLKVDELWRRVSEAIEQDRPRASIVEHVFRNTTSAGAKYFTRMALNQMRINVGLGTLTRAIAEAFEVPVRAVEHLYTMTNDIGLAAVKAREGESSLEHGGLVLFRPYQFMNAHKIDDPDLIIPEGETSGEDWILETKYDGARLQIHVQKRPWRVRMYSRRLKDDTEAMPDIVAALKDAWTGGDAIIEGEVVAFDAKLKKKLPFSAVLQRIGRKRGIEEAAREMPLILFPFDVLLDHREGLMDTSQGDRRGRLSKLFRPSDRVRAAESLITNRRKDMDAFFKKAVRSGQEGIMVKDPGAVYIPGKRTENWMKLKPAFETLDVVVVGGIWGSGRRRGMLSSLIVAVRGEKNEFLTVGKVGSGFSEEVLRDLTERREPKIVVKQGSTVEIEPETVIEVDFQDIQKTDRYSSGYALRIPRFRVERTDKSTREADSLSRLERLYRQSH